MKTFTETIYKNENKTETTTSGLALMDNIGLGAPFQPDWSLTPKSSFSEEDKNLFDTVLYNNLNLVSNNKQIERVERYEKEFGRPSNEFFKQWSRGNVASSPETHDWAVLYKSLFL